MKFFSWTLVSVLFWALFSANNAFAAQVYVEAATGSGVNSEDLTTTTSLVQSSVTDVSSNTLVEQPGQADVVLRPKLMRLGEAYILSISKVKNGQVIASSQLKAAHMSELDKVAERLTRSVLLGENASKNSRVGEITDEEAHEGTQRRPTRGETYIGLGGAEFGNLNTTGIGYGFGIAHAWDMNQALLKIQGEGDFNGSAFFISAGIGGNYFLSTADVAPYLAADFGLGLAKEDESLFSGATVGGFVVGGGAGVEFFRSSSVNLDLSFRIGALLHENDFGDPRVLSLRLGLYF
jgi:hypothetical protein